MKIMAGFNTENMFLVPGLSEREAAIVARLTYDKRDVVSNQEFIDLLPAGYKYKNKVISGLKKKHILSPIKNGFYTFVPLESVPTGIRTNEFLIPNIFFPKKNYYIGYSTLFNSYGFSEQIFQTIYVFNTSMAEEKIISGVLYKFKQVTDKYMYGLEKIKINNESVIVSSKERTLIDLIYINKDIGESINIFETAIKQNSVDIKKLIEYVALFPSVSTRKRIGMILEKLNIDDKTLEKLLDSIKNTSLTSFSASRKGKINKKWGVIINDTQG